jgi:acetyl-CoA synthetase
MIPATNQLKSHDFSYRFDAAGVSTIVCTADDGTVDEAEIASAACPQLKNKLKASN